MNRAQLLFQHLKDQAQGLFWKYASITEVLASRTALSAYKASFVEFLEYAAGQHHLKKITQIRKRHVDSYMVYLRRNGGSEYLVQKRVYAICFWLKLIDDHPELPRYESFRFAWEQPAAEAVNT